LYQSVVTDASGHFKIGGVAPGDYKLFAWDNLEPYAYFDPVVLDKVETRGRPVHIAESSNQTVNLSVIAAEEP